MPPPVTIATPMDVSGFQPMSVPPPTVVTSTLAATMDSTPIVAPMAGSPGVTGATVAPVPTIDVKKIYQQLIEQGILNPDNSAQHLDYSIEKPETLKQ